MKLRRPLPIDLPEKELAAFCRRWKGTELALFGSVLRDHFGPASVVDLLVTFEKSAPWSLMHLVQMQEELEALLGRSVDLIARTVVERSPNYIRRRQILSHVEEIYEA